MYYDVQNCGERLPCGICGRLGSPCPMMTTTPSTSFLSTEPNPFVNIVLTESHSKPGDSTPKDSEIEAAIRKHKEAIDVLSKVDRNKVLRLMMDSNLKAEELFKEEHPYLPICQIKENKHNG